MELLFQASDSFNLYMYCNFKKETMETKEEVFVYLVLGGGYIGVRSCQNSSN